jgi:hypothetical protein
MLALMLSITAVYVLHAIKGAVQDISQLEKNSDTPVVAQINWPKTGLTNSAAIRQFTLQLEMKGKLPEKGVITISSNMKRSKTAETVNALADHLRHLKKRVYCLLEAEIPEFSGKFEMENFLRSLLEEYDLVILENHCKTTDPECALYMGSSDLNLVLLVNLSSSMASVKEYDLLHEEYQIPEMNFVYLWTKKKRIDFAELAKKAFALIKGFKTRKA